ncbi:Uncharacterized protein TSPI_06926 [Trichinella spiralis]|uniref:Secreted protein n=1 Tax=Trichinella spiralis TaxID=6334 RepID=A0ABR3K1L8_TRISP
MRLLKRIRFVVVQHLLYAFQKDCIGRRREMYCFSFSYGCGKVDPPSTSPSGTPFTSNFTTQLADGLEATMDRHLGSFALSICWPTFASARIIAPSFECRLFVIFYIVHPETDQLNNYPSTPMTESFKLHGVADYRHPHRHIWRA